MNETYSEPTKPNRTGKIWLLLSIFVVVITVDQVSKVLAKQLLEGAGTLSYAGDFFRWHYSENTGAFLSLGAGLSEEVRFWVFNVAVAVVLLGLLISIILNDDDRPLVLLTYGLVIAGGVGNLIDRFVHNGAVVDFMNVGIGNLRTGIFNVADMAITTGVLLLIFYGFKPHRKEPTHVTPQQPDLSNAE